MVETCKCCGAVIPPKGLFTRTKKRIFDYIAKHPQCTSNQIRDAVYADDPNGGPLASNIISVHLTKMRPILRENGLDIVSCGGPGATYELIKVK